MKKFICVFVLSLLVVNIMAADGWYNGWGYRQKVSINYNSVSNNLVDFPVLITESNVVSSLFTNALANGDDILFTSSDGVTKLSHELEDYDAVNEELVAWIKIPALSNTANTDIYMYYGDSTASNQENVTNVWANGFVGVWHLGEKAGMNMDSTANANNAMTNGIVDMTATGKIDGADSFDTSVESWLDTGVRERDPDIDTGTNSLTVSAWCRPNASLAGTRYIVADGYNNGASNYNGFDIVHTVSSIYLYFGQANSNRVYIATPNGGLNVWKYVTIAWDKDSSLVKLYLNGVQKNSATSVGHSLRYVGTIKIGSNSGHWLSGTFDGSIDEVRISRTARSGDWIATEYNNQNDPVSFATSSAEEIFVPAGTTIIIQ